MLYQILIDDESSLQATIPFKYSIEKKISKMEWSALDERSNMLLCNTLVDSTSTVYFMAKFIHDHRAFVDENWKYK